MKGLLMVLVAAGACACTSSPTPARPPGVVFTGRAVAVVDATVLTDDGRALCGHVDGDTPRSLGGIVQLTPWSSLAGNGDVVAFSAYCSTGAPISVKTRGVAAILAQNVFRRPDGSTFFEIPGNGHWELPDLHGATSCNRHVCIKDGSVVLNSSTYDASSSIPALGTPPLDPLLAQSFENCTKEKLLASDGRVFEVEYETGPPPTISFVPIDGLPPIARMDGTFLYDRDGNAYYTGRVWAPDDDQYHQGGLSTTMLPPDTPTYDCHCTQKFVHACVTPTVVGRLAGARMGSIYALATYAIQPDGTVKCWATAATRYPSNAPGCLSFE